MSDYFMPTQHGSPCLVRRKSIIWYFGHFDFLTDWLLNVWMALASLWHKCFLFKQNTNLYAYETVSILNRDQTRCSKNLPKFKFAIKNLVKGAFALYKWLHFNIHTETFLQINFNFLFNRNKTWSLFASIPLLNSVASDRRTISVGPVIV